MNRVHDPMSKLPTEMISRIFNFCRLAAEDRVPFHALLNPIPHTVVPPLLFGAVCQKWREIAWTTPQLWTRISVYLDPTNALLQQRVVEEWLSRSAHLPLTIRLRSRREKDISSFTLLFSSLFDLLNEQSWRWAEVDLNIPHSLISRLEGNEQGVPMLRNLQISLLSPPRKLASFHFGHAPSLRSVEIYGFPFGSIGIDWSNVTTVKLGTIATDETLQLFQQASRMISCEISSAVESAPGVLITDNVITHHLLEHLDIDLSEDVPGQLLPKISLPALQNLSYHGGSILTLTSFLIRSTPPLLYLHIDDIDATEEEVFELLRATPLLQRLRALHCLALGNRFLDLLAKTAIIPRCDDADGPPMFLPCLVTLHLLSQCRYSWRLVPPIFALGALPEGHHRRPLNNVEINILRSSDDEDEIEQGNVQDILAGIEHGIDLTISNEETGTDLIERAYQDVYGEDDEESSGASEDEDLEQEEHSDDDE